MLLKWVINLDNRNLHYSTFQLPVNRLPHIPSKLRFGKNRQGKLLRTKLYGGSELPAVPKLVNSTKLYWSDYPGHYTFWNRLAASLSVFATTISCPFQTSFNPPLPTQFSTHNLCTLFDQAFDIAIVFQNEFFDYFGLSCHVLIIYTCTELQSLTGHIFQNVLTVVMQSLSTLC
jgi:hypothetical protein